MDIDDMNLKQKLEGMSLAVKQQADDLERNPPPPREGGRNCLSYWFPKLVQTGLPVPRTEIIPTDINFWPWSDGKEPDGIDELCDLISGACQKIGSKPYFLRTGMGSGKHSWKNTCFLKSESPALIRQHVYELWEWSEMVDMLGLPTNVWCVREMLPTTPIAILDAYGDFPLVKEIRGFVRDGKILCSHPYWPNDSVRIGNRSRNDDLSDMWFRASVPTEEEFREVNELLLVVAKQFAGDGAWSVDVLKTEHSWYITDMAEMNRSFHWPDCQNASA